MKLTLKAARSFVRNLPASVSIQRGMYSACIELGFERFEAHGDSKLLSELVCASYDSAGYSGGLLRKYVESHASVTWQKDKKCYKQADGPRMIAERELSFWEWKSASNPPNTSVRKFETVLGNMIKQLNGLITDERVDNVARAKKVLEMLRNA